MNSTSERLLKDWPELKPALSVVIDLQTKALRTVLDANLNGVFPDEKPCWRPLDDYDASDPDSVESAAENESYLNNMNDLANHRMGLAEVRIDRAAVMLGLQAFDDPEINHMKAACEWPTKGEPFFILLGEIAHMPGHVTVVRSDGKVFPVVHDACFYITPPGET